MANKYDVLSERNKYYNKRRDLDKYISTINNMIKSADTALDGKNDVALRTMLSECKSDLYKLQNSLADIERQLYNLAQKLEREQARLKEENDKK